MPDYTANPMYRDCCCGDCREYGAEIANQCEVLSAELAKSPLGFGEFDLPETTSMCKAFKPSDDLLRDLADAEAYHHESMARDSAWRNGAHA